MTSLTASSRALIIVCAIALAASGCGAIAEQALESAVEKSVEASAESNGEDVDFDLDLDSGSADISVGDSTGSVGADLDRPDWLDGDYELPDGMIIMTHMTDSAVGQSVVSGQVTDATIGEIVDQQRAEIQSHGFEIISDSAESTAQAASLRGEHADGRIIEISLFGVEEFTQFSLAIYEADGN